MTRFPIDMDDALKPFDLWSRCGRPSRDFYVGQAVLNAMAAAKMNTPTLAYVTSDGWNLPGWLEVAVCREFRKLNEAWS